MSKVDSIKIELRLHETLFFAGILLAILLMIWMVGHYESTAIAWLFIAAVLVSAAVGFSIWNYRQFKRLLSELGRV
jgi:hypothetical protein